MSTSKKAIAYLRVSGRGQLKGDGLARQRCVIEQWAKANRVEIVAWYQEKGITGTTEDRPALARLLLDLEDVHANARLVVVERLDRLARDLVVQETIIAELRRLDRELSSATEGDDLLSGDASRELIRQIMGAVAQYDKRLVVAKLRAARERAKERDGRCEGRKPYGARPGEGMVLDRIRTLRRRSPGCARRSYDTIARTLTRDGTASRAGKPWSPEVIRRLVRRHWPALA